MERENLLKGSLCMALGFFFVALFAAFFKAATAQTSSIWAIFIGYSFACVIQFILISKQGLSFLKTQRPWGHVGRVGFGLIASILYVVALTQIPLMNATLLFNTAPLFVPLFAISLLKSKISLKTWISLGLGFIGVVFILRPNCLSLDETGNIIGLTAGLVQALAFIFVKMLTTTEPIRRINFYFFFGSACVLGPIAFLMWPVPPLESWLWSLCAGTMSFLAQLFIVKGYHYADASHIGPFQYTSVVVSGILGWLIWSQTPTLFDLIGTALVIAGGAFAIIFYHPPTKTPLQKI